ncbi:PLA2G6 (predicted) [Pycnogonum litorale]
MSQLWYGLSGIYTTLARTGSLSESDPFQVLASKSENYAERPIHCREDSLVIYGPIEKEPYEVVLLKSIATDTFEVYSIYRSQNRDVAEQTFLLLKDKLSFLSEQQPTANNVSTLQKISNVIRDNPGWSLMHVTVQLGIKSLIRHPNVLPHLDSRCVHTGMTPLHVAIKAQNMQTIVELIDLKADFHILCNNGNSVFHYAAVTNKEIVQVLSKVESAVINSLNHNGQTALHLACLEDKPDCVHALLRAGIDVNSNSEFPILHCAVDESSSARCAKEIVDMYPDQLHTHDMKNGGTPLHWVKSVPCLEALVDLGCNINEKNFHNDSALHVMVDRERLVCVIALLSLSANPDAKGCDGNTPLHYAVKKGNVPIMQALLAFGADVNAVNNLGQTPRHLACITDYTPPGITGLILSTGINQSLILYTLHAVGAARCPQGGESCNSCQDGCIFNGSFDGIAPDTLPSETDYRQFYDEMLTSSTIHKSLSSEPMDVDGSPGNLPAKNKLRVLCLDGGGIRGLVLIKMLMMMQDILKVPIVDCFDWIAGTSTGGILTLGLAVGKSLTDCLGLYFRLKDKVFKGNRPYDSKSLEEFLKKELGDDDVKMSDIKHPRVFVTAVLADKLPAELVLYRNYKSPHQLLNDAGMGVSNSSETSPNKSSEDVTDKKVINADECHPCDQPVWNAARATGAAPTYFRSFGNVIDGGLIANNPTLDLITEIHVYNQVLKCLDRVDEMRDILCVVSLGTGKLPVISTDIDVFRPDRIWDTAKAFRGMSALVNLIVDQATCSNGKVIDRARAWCHMIDVPYFRFNPSISKNINLDETSNELLIKMLWDTMVYMHSQKHTINDLRKILLKGCSSS